MKPKPLNLLLCFGLSLHLTASQAQLTPPSKYKVAPVTRILNFDQMSEDEIRLDTTLNNADNRMLKSMSNGSAFVKGTSEEKRKKAISYHMASSLRYRDNRSRYYLQHYINNAKPREETFPSLCGCALIGNTIKVSMGLVFGEIITIDINKDSFSSTYNEDESGRPSYKKSLSDTGLYDKIKVSNIQQKLVLQKKPSFKVGDTLLGLLEFRSRAFYKMEGWEHGLNYEPRLDQLFTQGVLNFKCEVKKNLSRR